MLKLDRSTVAAFVKILPKEVGRYAMHQANLDKGQLVATDGRKLVVIPVETVDDDETPETLRSGEDSDGMISRDVLTAVIGKGSKAQRPNGFLSVNGSATIMEGNGQRRGEHSLCRQHLPDPSGAIQTMTRNDENGEYPRWEAVVPKRSGTTILVNATYLAQVMAAVTGGVKDGTVRIHFPDEPDKRHAPILVEGVSAGSLGNDTIALAHPGSFGVVMPISEGSK